ncbi:MAG: hypothetical protein Q8M34_04060 [Thermodesulfovibrionales bacterium]|nr:hypothetical protein [Thermodesulfovibrionales bacterium]
MEEQKIISPPKPFWNITVLLIVLIPFIVLGTVQLNLGFVSEAKDILIILVVLMLIILAVLFFTKPQSIVIVSKEKGFLEIQKKDQAIKEYRLSDIRRLTARNVKSALEFPQYSLILENLDGNDIVLFTSERLYSKKQWNDFSEKLSGATGKPLSEEVWVENYDGKLVIQPEVEVRLGRKFKNSFLLISILPPLLGAIVFMKILNRTNFMHTGLAVLIVYISLIFIYINKFKQFSKGGEYTENKLSVFLLILSTITSQIFLYLMFCFMLAGFKVPFW